MFSELLRCSAFDPLSTFLVFLALGRSVLPATTRRRSAWRPTMWALALKEVNRTEAQSRFLRVLIRFLNSFYRALGLRSCNTAYDLGGIYEAFPPIST